MESGFDLLITKNHPLTEQRLSTEEVRSTDLHNILVVDTWSSLVVDQRLPKVSIEFWHQWDFLRVDRFIVLYNLFACETVFENPIQTPRPEPIKIPTARED